MRKTLHYIVIIVLAAWLLPATKSEPAAAAAQMPAFELEDVVTGKPVSSEAFTGKSLLVIFFATWCPPCVQEIPDLIKLHDQYRDSGFSVVAFSVDQGKREVQELVEKKQINYPVMMADDSITRDFGGVYGIPTSFLISRKGTVVKKYSGYVPHSILVRDLEQVIN